MALISCLSLLLVISDFGVNGVPYRLFYPPVLPPGPLAVLQDSPYSVAKSSVQVPLMVVPQTRLEMITNPRIKAVSPTRPLVTCSTQQNDMDATPAVKIVLKKPIYMEAAESTIPFPAFMTIRHEGFRLVIPVGMLIAPVPDYGFDNPHLIRVVYAIPTSPLPYRNPYYAPPFLPYGHPIVPYYTSNRPPIQQNFMPYGHTQGIKQKPIITVLNFPSAVATPETLYYEEPSNSEDEDELGNRNPPEALPPSGIIQSTAPQANLQEFLNSKESLELQALRDQAEKNKNDEGASSGVEAL